MNTPFWLVWRKNGNAPAFCHDDFFAARDEAERLARTNPGTTFFILAPVESVTKAEFTRETFVVDPDAMIPF